MIKQIREVLMRIQSLVNIKNNNFKNFNNFNNTDTKFRQKTNIHKLGHHQYTGNASTDLAYASLFDNEIAKDLKLMGLI